MRLFQGCLRADEIAMTRAGANSKDGKGLTGVLVQKSADKTDPAPEAKSPPENSDMDAAELAKAQASALDVILTMDDVQKSHYLALPTADAKVAFLAKSADERKTEADTAKSAADKVTLEAEAAKAGKSAREVELEKRAADQDKRIADLEKADKDRRVDAEIEKRAREEFDGFPGGQAAVVDLLKAYAVLPDEARKASEDVLKGQCELAKRAGSHLGFMSESEIEKAAPAQAELQKKAADVAKRDGVSIQVAKGRVLSDPNEADLFARVRAEEDSGRASIN